MASFSEDLIHELDSVKEQSSNGLYTLNRINKFVNNLSKIFLKSSKDIHDISKHEQNKRDAIVSDELNDIIHAFANIQDVMEEYSKHGMKFAKDIDQDINIPINNYLKTADKTYKDLLKKKDKLDNNLNKLNNEVNKQKKIALKDWSTLQKTRVDILQAAEKKAKDQKGAKIYAKVNKIHLKQKEKTISSFKKVEDNLTNWNTSKYQYEITERKELLNNFEQLEQERVTQSIKAMNDIAIHLRTLITPYNQLIEKLEHVADQLNADQMIKSL